MPVPSRPEPGEYAPYYEKYVAHVPETAILPALAAQLDDVVPFLRAVPEDRAGVPHPPYTWTIKEVVGHLVDCERIFGVRALRFARGDATELPGFDENAYARQADCNARTLADLVEEFEAVRRSHLCLFRHFRPADWQRSGVANRTPVSVRALAFILVGHVRHHLAIVRQRLGASA